MLKYFFATYANYVAHIAEKFIPCLLLDTRNFNYKEQRDVAARITLVLFLGCYEERHCAEEAT